MRSFCSHSRRAGRTGHEGDPSYNCAIQADSGAVVCWGNNYEGQATPPSSVDGTGGMAEAVAVGTVHSLAIRHLPACSDGIDNDGDGSIDFPVDPGCRSATAGRENPQYQGGLNNDNQTRIDFDGRGSLNGGTPIAEADPQYLRKSWRNTELPGCGLRFEVVFVAPLFARLARRRRA